MLVHKILVSLTVLSVPIPCAGAGNLGLRRARQTSSLGSKSGDRRRQGFREQLDHRCSKTRTEGRLQAHQHTRHRRVRTDSKR